MPNDRTPPPPIPGNGPHVAGSPWLLDEDQQQPQQPQDAP